MKKYFPRVSIFLVAISLWIGNLSAFGATVAEEFDQEIQRLESKLKRWSIGAGGGAVAVSTAIYCGGPLISYGSVQVFAVTLGMVLQTCERVDDVKKVRMILELAEDSGSHQALLSEKERGVISDLFQNVKKNRKAFRKAIGFSVEGEKKMLGYLSQYLRAQPRSFFY